MEECDVFFVKADRRPFILRCFVSRRLYRRRLISGVRSDRCEALRLTDVFEFVPVTLKHSKSSSSNISVQFKEKQRFQLLVCSTHQHISWKSRRR